MIVEDEFFASERLSRMVARLRPDYSVAVRTEDVAGSVAFLENNTVDLIFMDVKLADGVCFDIFDRLDIDTPVIFITAYGRLAEGALRANTIDCLSKPLEEESLQHAVEKFERLYPK